MSSNDNDARIMKFAHNLPVNVHTIPHKGQEIHLTSDAAQRARLAHNHDLVAVEQFQASFHLQPRAKGQVHLRGEFSATIIQHCVISGEEITQQLSEHFTLLFVPQMGQTQTKDKREVILDAYDEEQDNLEFFNGGQIDLGAVIEEFFCLAIDPYPRKREAEFHPVSIGAAQEETCSPESPFATLKKLAPS